MKANHNRSWLCFYCRWAVSSYAKLLKWKQITTIRKIWESIISCKFLCKVTKMKANHNAMGDTPYIAYAVSSYAKLLKWKQITTVRNYRYCFTRCKFLCKVTKMKANHNNPRGFNTFSRAVSSYAKLLKWKQITTGYAKGYRQDKL